MGHRHKCPDREGLFGDLCEALGDRVVIVIRQDGRKGAFRGTLARVRDCDVQLVLNNRKHEECKEDTTSSHHLIKDGDLVTIPICQIAAFARIH